MGRGRGRVREPWRVMVAPAGTAAEAAAVAQRVQAMVAGWIRRDFPDWESAKPGRAVPGETGPDEAVLDEAGLDEAAAELGEPVDGC